MKKIVNAKSRKTRQAGRKTRRYTRRNPLARLHRGVEMMIKTSDLASSKVESWRACMDDPPSVLLATCSASENLRRSLTIFEACVAKLEEVGFEIPRRSKAICHVVGSRVRVLDEHRASYMSLYEEQIGRDPKVLDDLLVTKVMPSGEVVVKRDGVDLPIVARKSHLRKIATRRPGRQGDVQERGGRREGGFDLPSVASSACKGGLRRAAG
jgi:hypothetical protein